LEHLVLNVYVAEKLMSFKSSKIGNLSFVIKNSRKTEFRKNQIIYFCHIGLTVLNFLFLTLIQIKHTSVVKSFHKPSVVKIERVIYKIKSNSE